MKDFKVRFFILFLECVLVGLNSVCGLGTSSVALDVLADVTSQYLLNVGRTIRFLSDKFGKAMTPEVR
jgi:hypothetical protein